jgi:20S proteasome alpha/beta subunit
MSYNGGAIVAMKGKNCVAIAADRRFGIQAQTLALDFQVRLHDCTSQWHKHPAEHMM